MTLENLQFSHFFKVAARFAFICLAFLSISTTLLVAQTTNLIWDKTYGGTSWEEFRSVTEASDGNIMLLGSQSSPVSGNNSEASNGYNDYWLMKVNPANGNIIWDYSYGGDIIDAAQEVHETQDGGFIVGGQYLGSCNDIDIRIIFIGL